MDDNIISLIVASAALLISLVTFFIFNKERSKKKVETSAPGDSTRPLQLQAYERLVVLADRIALPNLISRASQQKGSLHTIVSDALNYEAKKLMQ